MGPHQQVQTGRQTFFRAVPGSKSGLLACQQSIVKWLLAWLCLFANAVHADDAAVAVWDFDCLELSRVGVSASCQLSRVMSEILLEQLLAYPGVRVVERARLREILDEQKLGSSALADEDARIRLGRIAGAKRMIFGSLITLGDIVRADVRLVSTETAQILGAQEASANTADLPAAMAVAARALVTQMGYGKTGGQTGTLTQVSAGTLTLFDQGLALMDRQDFAAAIEVFKKILTGDAEFKPAERQLRMALDKLTRQ
ncbi:MAG: hypothetical protein AUJ20_13390 [Comamonadaceae bacterium CG1_02_60_18]|nr:MAG: hypothetical protein AUJ20_13390 [Comamonadaceae bacterium CG1_02_60_18]